MKSRELGGTANSTMSTFFLVFSFFQEHIATPTHPSYPPIFPLLPSKVELRSLQYVQSVVTSQVFNRLIKTTSADMA